MDIGTERSEGTAAGIRPLFESLEAEPIGAHRVRVKTTGRRRYVEQVDFCLELIPDGAGAAPQVIFSGRYSAGRSSAYIPGWIDGEFSEGKWGRSVTSHERNAVFEVISERLGVGIPPGGRFWLAYEAFEDADFLRETRAGLAAGLPAVATPIGALLFRAGCWAGIRDWYFAEGGREGLRKLQGNRPSDPEQGRLRAAEVAAILRAFLCEDIDDVVRRRAQSRASWMLAVLGRLYGVEKKDADSTSSSSEAGRAGTSSLTRR